MNATAEAITGELVPFDPNQAMKNTDTLLAAANIIEGNADAMEECSEVHGTVEDATAREIIVYERGIATQLRNMVLDMQKCEVMNMGYGVCRP